MTSVPFPCTEIPTQPKGDSGITDNAPIPDTPPINLLPKRIRSLSWEACGPAAAMNNFRSNGSSDQNHKQMEIISSDLEYTYCYRASNLRYRSSKDISSTFEWLRLYPWKKKRLLENEPTSRWKRNPWFLPQRNKEEKRMREGGASPESPIFFPPKFRLEHPNVHITSFYGCFNAF